MTFDPVLRRRVTYYCLYCSTPVTPPAFRFRAIQIYGTLADPKPEEREFLDFEHSTCLDYKRSFFIRTGQYVGKAPPEELVSASGWHFMSMSPVHPNGFIGFGNSSTKAIASWKLPCGTRTERLEIGYLRSFANMGAVKIDVSREGNPVGTTTIIDALWETHASEEVFKVAPIPDGDGAVLVSFEVLSSDTEGYYAEVVPSSAFTGDGFPIGTARAHRKFRISAIACC